VVKSRIAACLLLLSVWIACRTAAAQGCKVSVPATIVDANTGKFLPSITAAMLHARVNKSFVPVTRLERINNFRVLLLVDASGSMSSDAPNFLSQKKWTVSEVRKTLEEDFAPLPPGVQVGFGIFNERVSFSNEFTSDPDNLHRLITDTTSRLKRPGGGGTAILDALHGSLDQFGRTSPGDTVLIVTDGGENKSRVSEKQIAREFSEKGVRLFVVLATDNHPTGPEEIGGPILMYDLAERTGGSVHTIDTNDARWGDKKWSFAAKESLHRFWNEQVLSAYLVHFTVPPGTSKDQKWLLAIDPAANGRKKMAAGFPSRLGPCPLVAAAQ
jgi:von Willebrand factor type A domain